MNIKHYIVFFLLITSSNVFSQSPIHITGKIIDRRYPDLLLENTMVINKRTQQGFYTEGNNMFSVNMQPTDTLIISATGYQLRKVCFKDTAEARLGSVIIPLERLSVQLKEITIFQQRDWRAIEDDLQKLGYKESDYRLKGAEAWNSPITALYEAFSRKEQSRRKVAELENADMRRGLLTEILHIYNKTGLIQLREEEIPFFIDYLHFDDAMLQSLSQYELALYVKERFSTFVWNH